MTILDAASVRWAIEQLESRGDGDLFPPFPEMSAVLDMKEELATQISSLTTLLEKFSPNPSRRFLVPKGELAHRQATQLHPMDSIILTALVYEYGTGIENRRAVKDVAFSNRFRPSSEEGLYERTDSWNDFWKAARSKGKTSGAILTCDISDFYNQIYHHTVENQLIASSWPNQAVKWVVELLKATSAGVSRGVPVGPHAVHLLAEATLIPVDEALAAAGLEYIRFVDDIIVFCDDSKDAQVAFERVSKVLDSPDRLHIQRSKTKIWDAAEFDLHCHSMLEDRPITENEEELLSVVKKYSGGNPYAHISFNMISEADWSRLSSGLVTEVITEYVESEPIDFVRLRWFYRRLAQVGHPGALEVSLDHFEALTPCLPDMFAYMVSVQADSNLDLLSVGTRLLEIYKSRIVQESEYFRLSVLSLFARVVKYNHTSDIIRLYEGADPYSRREILLAAQAAGEPGWFRTLKGQFGMMDPWQRLAYLYSSRLLPEDERKYFLAAGLYGEMENLIARWAKKT